MQYKSQKSSGRLQPWMVLTCGTVIVIALVLLNLVYQYRASRSLIDGRLVAIAHLIKTLFPDDFPNKMGESPVYDQEALRVFENRRQDISEQFDLDFIVVAQLREGQWLTLTGYPPNLDAASTFVRSILEGREAQAALELRQNKSHPQEHAELGIYQHQDGGGRYIVDSYQDQQQRPYAFLVGISHQHLDSVLKPIWTGSLLITFTLLLTLVIILTLVARFFRQQSQRHSYQQDVNESMALAFAGLESVTNSGGWWLDLASHQLRWSPQTYRIHELPIDTPVDVESAIAYYAPHEQERIRGHVAECSQEGTSWDEEFDLVTATGRLMRARATGQPTRDDSGTITHLYGTFQDVTKFAYQSDLIGQYQEILEGSDTLVAVVDEDCAIDYINAAFVRACGNMRGHKFIDALVEEDRAIFTKDCVPALTAGQSWYGALNLRSPMGSRLSTMALMLSRRRRVGLKRQILMQFTDITALSRLLRQKDALITAIPSYLLILDGEQCIVEILNARYLTGVSEDALHGKNLLETVSPEQLEDTRTALHEASHGRIGYVRYESKQGDHVRHLRRVIVPFNDQHYLVYAEDMTTEVALRREKEILLRELAHRVKNNFQIMSSLLGITINKSHNAAVTAALNDFRERIYVMGLVHQAMFAVQEQGPLDLCLQLRMLERYAQQQFQQQGLVIHHYCPPTPILTTSEAGVYLGMLFNELLTNTFKHAPDHHSMQVRFGIVTAGDRCTFFYRDEGGYYDREVGNAAGGVGTELINIFCRALRAHVKRTTTASLPTAAQNALFMNSPPVGIMTVIFSLES